MKVGLIGTIVWAADTIKSVAEKDIDPFETYVNVGKLTKGSGVGDGLFKVGKIASAGVSVAAAEIGVGKLCSASASALSASAHAQYGLNNSIGARASLVRAEACLGPVNASVGLNLDLAASIGVNGISVSLLGFGFSIGPKIEFKTPVFDFSFGLF